MALILIVIVLDDRTATALVLNLHGLPLFLFFLLLMRIPGIADGAVCSTVLLKYVCRYSQRSTIKAIHHAANPNDNAGQPRGFRRHNRGLPPVQSVVQHT